MRAITEIIIHCTATPEGRAVSVEDVDRWHKAQGWRCIGYHYLVGLRGEVWQGRPLSEAGAHCRNHNAFSIGVCYVGGLGADGVPADTRTPAQRAALLELLTELRQRFPFAKVRGHRDFAAKACPCFSVRAEYGKLFPDLE